MGPEGLDRAKCIKRFVQIAGLKPRFPSSRPRADLFIAGNAFRSAEQRDADIKGFNNLILGCRLGSGSFFATQKNLSVVVDSQWGPVAQHG